MVSDTIYLFTAPDGTTTSYTYDASGQLVMITPDSSGTLTLGDHQWTVPTRLGLPGGTSQLRTYDELMRPKQIRALDPADNPILNYQYDHDAENNILSRTTEHGTYTYDYDDLDRLVTADNPTLPDENYSYDPVGNRLSSTDTTGTWQYSEANELLTYDDTQLEYNANGNLIKKTSSGNITHYEYTLDSRLMRVYSDDGSLDARYGYDPFGRRLWKEVDGERTYFFYAEEGLIAEANESGNVIRQYGWRPDGLWGTDPLYLKQGGLTYYYHNDHLGTPQKIVNVSGQVVWEASYTAFGEAQAAGTLENPLRLPEQYYDKESGLSYNYMRYYDGKLGRYIQNDPIDIQGGLNTYIYAKNNVLIYIDPLGLVDPFAGTCDFVFEDITTDERTKTVRGPRRRLFGGVCIPINIRWGVGATIPESGAVRLKGPSWQPEPTLIDDTSICILQLWAQDVKKYKIKETTGYAVYTCWDECGKMEKREWHSGNGRRKVPETESKKTLVSSDTEYFFVYSVEHPVQNFFGSF